MTDEKHIDAYLGDIQGVFINKKISRDPDFSWGQFLDNSNDKGQVGLYGTIAGAIALKAKNGSRSQDATAAEQQLANYWGNRKTKPANTDNLCQNIRLAALLLGLGFEGTNHATVMKEIADELNRRLIANEDMWDEFSSSNTVASRPSEFSTAIILIFSFAALHFFKGNAAIFGQFKQTLVLAAQALQKRYLDDKNRDRPYVAALLIAVVLVLGKGANKSIRKKLSDYAQLRESVFKRQWQYIDYIDCQQNYRRDYFILPHRLLIPLLLMRADVDGTHFLEAKTVLDDIKKALDSDPHKLFVESAGRPSSLEQALVILALESSRQGKGFRLGLVWPWVKIESSKKRPQERLFAGFFLATVYLPVFIMTIADWLIGAYGAYIWAGGLTTLEVFKTVPKWGPSAVLFCSAVVRKPNELLSALLWGASRK